MQVRIIEALLATVLTQNPDILSPYGQHGNPPMWDVLRKDGRTLSVRPARVVVRGGFGSEEKDGFIFGWHVRGEWPRSEQHQGDEVMKVAYMVDKLLSEGATPLAAAISPENV